jgi:hypothetical protein
MNLVKILEKNKKLHIYIIAVTLKVLMQNHEQKIKMKKSENPRFYGQNKLFS